MGRKPIPIDPNVVLAMAYVGAQNEEIADFIGCSTDTIERRFAGDLAKMRAQRKFRLRKLQWNAAEKGDTGMLIFLGKQELKQRDGIEITMYDLANMTDEQLEAVIAGKDPYKLKSKP